MSRLEYLLFPWDGFKDASRAFKAGWCDYVNKGINYIQLNTKTRRYEYIKDGKNTYWRRVQSLEYVLAHWPEGLSKKVVVQAGGCLGLWPKILAYSFEWVYTFEPQAQAFFFLSLNCSEKNIIKMQMALGAENKSVIARMTNTPGRCKVVPDGFVPMITLDTLNLSACDALLLDTEGYEFDILQGGIKTINKFRPIILCEDWEDENIKNFMNQNNYEFIIKVDKDNIYKPKESKWNA